MGHAKTPTHRGRRDLRNCAASIFGILALLALAGTGAAGTISGVSITPADTAAGATTSYTLVFTPSTTHPAGCVGDCAYIILDSNSGAALGDGTLGSISGGLTGAKTCCSGDRAVIQIRSGTMTAGVSYTVVYNGVLNPGAAGTGPAYTLNTSDGGSTVDGPVAIPGTTYTGSPVPTVTNPIPDMTGNTGGLKQEDGLTVVEANLNNVFTDGDGDPLTFTIVPGHDTAVVTPSIVGNSLRLTGAGTGTTTVTVKADDLSDGFITDAFQVQVHGLLTPADVAPASLTAGANGNVVITFTPSTTLSATDQVFVVWPPGFTVNAANLVSITGGTTAVTVYKNATNTGFRINSGTWGAGSLITITLSNITNPGAAGNPGDYVIRAQDSGDSWFSYATVPGDTFAAGSVPTVVTPIPDFTGNSGGIAVEDGETLIEADLNNVFTDGDSDPLTFTVVPGHNTAVATASIVGGRLSVTGQGTGTTTVTVKADDLTDGFVTDAFQVQVHGLITPADVQPVSLRAGATGNAVITFTPSTTLTATDQIFVDWPRGFVVGSTTLQSVTGGTSDLTVYSNSTNTGFRLNSGTFNAGSLITITMQNITNPGGVGNTGAYRIRAQDSSDNWFNVGTIPGDALFGNDVIFDFGPGTGVWVNYNDNPFSWGKIHDTSPELVATGDVDGNGQGDVILDFGAGTGVWVNYNDNPASWRQIHTASPEIVVTGDLDNNGLDDVILDFGAGTGVWVNYNDNPASWLRIHPSSPELIAVGDLDGDDRDDVILDFGAGTGLWVNYNNTPSSWSMIHASSPELVAVGNLDGGAGCDVVIDFGAAGVWANYNNDPGDWRQIHASSPELMAIADLDGSGGEEIILDFGAAGVWANYNDSPSSWRQVHTSSPEIITVADMDDNGQAELVIDFGASGVWTNYNDNPASWTQVHGTSPQDMAAGNIDGN